MKIQLDFDNRTFRVEGMVPFIELIVKVKKLLPKDWSDWKLDGSSIIYWNNPITWTPNIVFPIEPYYNQQPTVVSTGGSFVTNDHIYNIEIT